MTSRATKCDYCPRVRECRLRPVSLNFEGLLLSSVYAGTSISAMPCTGNLTDWVHTVGRNACPITPLPETRHFPSHHISRTKSLNRLFSHSLCGDSAKRKIIPTAISTQQRNLIISINDGLRIISIKHYFIINRIL